ncbi:MAG: hypothetical protein ACP5NV_03770 [Candidatus Woesearchaeota archaeon]
MFGILIIAAILPLIKADNIVGNNYRNVTVRTYVNITNSKPEVLAVTIFQESNVSLRNITLSAGSTRIVTCNASLRDWNGYTDIVSVNATLWDVTNAQYSDPDNNNTHYTNSSCTNSGNGVNFTVNYVCQFPVYYYANNGTWNCTVLIADTYNKTGNRSNSTIFYPMYALNVTDGIDYGNVGVEDFSANKTANITNFGNRAINVTVEGYGAVRGDGLAMNCSLGGNIAVAHERFSLTDVDWSSRTPLSSSPQLISGLTIPKQTLPGTMMTNTTYWQLYVDSTNNPGGNCSGYVIFSAEAS